MINFTAAQNQMNGICNRLFFSVKNPQYFIFKKSSKTYFYSSLLFPKKVRDDISILYGFARMADNYVDSIPQQKAEFYAFQKALAKGLAGQKTNHRIIDDFLHLVKRKKIDHKWIKAFMYSMKLDTKKTTYKSFTELTTYLYGSAEVIGLMVGQIIDIEKRAQPYAQKLGRAMQYINFIRDIAEDNNLTRTYIPKSELQKYKLKNLHYETAINNPDQFRKLIRAQIKIYFQWQKRAEIGFKYLPPKYLLAIKTASDLYKWTAVQIYNDPFIVYRKKVKPSMSTIITLASQNMFKSY